MTTSLQRLSQPPPAAPAQHDAARTAGRGGIAVLSAKVFFILAGFAQQTLLPRFIGLDGYGALSRVLAPTNIANNVIVSSSIQGVSRSVASTPDDAAGQTLRRTFKVHAAIAFPLALAFFFFAPVYARFQGALHIVRPLQVVSIVLLMYGLYAPLVGALNGQRRFTAQAALDITYAALRTAGLLGLGWLFARGGHGTLGACVGFALAATLIFPIALRTTGTGSSGNAGPSAADHLRFIGPVALGQVFLQLLMQADIVVLGRFASHVTNAMGLADAAARIAADEVVGVYRACQLFAFLPFQLLITLTFIMFPMLAKAKAENDREAVALYVRTGNRLAFVFACVMVATVSALGPQLLRLAFTPDIAARGADAVRILALGQGAFSIFYIQTTVLTSLGRERRSALLTAISAGLIFVLSWLAGLAATAPDDLPKLTAIATSVALVLSAVIGALAVRNVAGAFLSVLTGIRVMLALGVVSALGLAVPMVERAIGIGDKGIVAKLMAVPEAAVFASITIALLVITGELGKADVAVVTRVLRRGRS